MLDSINRPRGNRLQWGGFGKKNKTKEEVVQKEYICPFSICGRKFTVEASLREHIERRHKAKQPEKEEVVVSTPHPAKSAKVPKQMLEESPSSSMIDTSTSSKPV